MLFLISAHLEVSAKNGPDARHQVVDHILAVHGLLVPGGILVSVFSPSPFWRAGRESVEFQNWIQTVNAQAVMCRRVLFGRVVPCSARKSSKSVNRLIDRLRPLRWGWGRPITISRIIINPCSCNYQTLNAQVLPDRQKYVGVSI